MKNIQKGKWGENQAVNYLIGEGYIILERNWRWQKSEIDIIARNEKFIVFIEVKTRQTDKYGTPENFVSKKQELMIIDAANHYLESNLIDDEARFDIISLIYNQPQTIEHFKDAFSIGN